MRKLKRACGLPTTLVVVVVDKARFLKILRKIRF